MLPNADIIRIGEAVAFYGPEELPSRTYAVDWRSGRISGFIDGKEAMEQAIYQILRTERFLYPIYSWNYGIELAALYGMSQPELQSALKRAVTEALTADARITAVRDFAFTQNEKRALSVAFTADTIFGAVAASLASNPA